MKQRHSIKTYIIRIYRIIDNDPRFIVGTVEKVGVNGKMAFSNRDELWEIMNTDTIKPLGRKKQNNKGADTPLDTSSISINKKGRKKIKKQH